MRNPLVVLVGALGCLAIFFARPATAEDWPQWGGHDDRNLVSEEKGLPESFVPGKSQPSGEGIDPATTENVKWVARLGSAANGVLYVASQRYLWAVQQQVGKKPQKQETTQCFE